MFDSFSASGFFVQTPFGPRKSGMPDSVEIPAPVSATVRLDEEIQEETTASSSDIDSSVLRPARPHGATENGTAAITLSHISAMRPPLSDTSMNDHVI